MSNTSNVFLFCFPFVGQVLALCLNDPEKNCQDKLDALNNAWEELVSYTKQPSLIEDFDIIIKHLYR